MREGLQQLRLAAVNIDGVLLNDTFSPVIHHFVTSRGGRYTAEVERRIFSQSRRVAGVEMAAAAGLRVSGEEALTRYFAERAEFLRQHPVALNDGALELVRRLRSLGLAVLCYGGLDRSHFDTHLGAYADLFDAPGYLCTDTFRPGIHEIATEVFGLAYDQVVVIDDVARVAECARELGVPFIGHPSAFAESFQRHLMMEAGARHIVGSLHEIDEELVRRVDREAAAGLSWSPEASRSAGTSVRRRPAA